MTTYKYSITAREFVNEYWFTNGKLSKAVTEILGYFEDGKITHKGREAYQKLKTNTKCSTKEKNNN